MASDSSTPPPSSKPIAALFFIAALFMTGISIAMEYRSIALGRPIPDWFMITLHMGHEHNLPAFLSAFMAALGSFFLWNIARNRRPGKDTGYWRLLAVLFALLAIDEAFAFHEKLPVLFNPVYQWLDSYAWRHASDIAYIIPFAAGLFVALLFLRFIISLPERTRLLIFAAGILFIAGALLIETSGLLFTHAASILAPAEEGMEMMGLILFAYALTDYRTNQRPA